ncbi:MAG: hypothetical protein ACRD2O_09845 [Terriglobia bacterium]
MHNPDFLGELCGVDHPKRITPYAKATSNTPESSLRIGFAISALPPSAAIVNAVRLIDLAPSGNLSNSLSAALIQETGRVFRVMAVAPQFLSHIR